MENKNLSLNKITNGITDLSDTIFVDAPGVPETILFFAIVLRVVVHTWCES